MAEQAGIGVGSPYQHYEDITSLKKHLNNGFGQEYIEKDTYRILLAGNQLTTGTATKFMSSNGDETIISSPRDATEQDWVFAMSADDVTANNLIVTATFTNASGVSTIVTGTLTDVDNSVDQEFDTPITTGYALTALSVSAAITTADLWVGVTGMDGSNVATMGIISNTATAATADQLFGVGRLYVRGESNHADSVDEDGFVDWMTPWGEMKKGGIVTTDGVDGTVETICYESDGVTTIKDAFNVISWEAKLTDEPTANSGFFMLTDMAVANVNGSGGDIFGVIDEVETAMRNVQFTACLGCSTWVTHIHAFAALGNALGDLYHLKFHYTPKGEALEKVLPITFVGDYTDDSVYELEPGTTAYLTISDIAGPTIAHANMELMSAREM